MSALELLKKQIECPICLNTFEESKALSCLHTFCQDCLQKHIRASSKSGTIQCPQCRRPAQIENNSASSLPSVFFIKELICSLKVLEQATKSDIACQNCSAGLGATAFCQACPPSGMFICEHCTAAHNTMKIFVDHRVIPLSELRKGPLIHLPLNQSTGYSCSAHKASLILYCYRCEKLICRDCTLIDHRDHKFDFVKSVATDVKDEIQTSLSVVRNNLIAVTRAKEDLNGAMALTKDHMTMSIDTINKAYDELVAVIEERRETMLNQAKLIANENMSALIIKIQEDSVKKTCDAADGVVAFAEALVDNGTDQELISMKPTIQKRILEVKETIKNLKLDRIIPLQPVPVISPCAEELRHHCQKSCIVQVQIQALDEIFVNQAGKAIFTVKSMADTSLPANLDLSAELISKNLKCTTPCSVQNIAPTTFQVTFKPESRGSHLLSVAMNQTTVATSDVVVLCPPSQLNMPVQVLDANEPWSVCACCEPEGILAVSEFGILKHDTTQMNRFQNTLVREVFAGSHPRGIAVEAGGNFFVTTDYKVFKFSKDCKLEKAIGTGKPGKNPSEFNMARCGRVYEGKLYVCDWNNQRIQVFDMELKFENVFGLDTDLRSPIDIDFDNQGNGYVTNIYKNEVVVFNKERQFERSFGIKDSGELLAPWGICVFGSHVYVTEHHGHCVSVFRLCGDFVCCFGQEGRLLGQLMYPHGITFDANGFCYVADEDNNRIQVF